MFVRGLIVLMSLSLLTVYPAQARGHHWHNYHHRHHRIARDVQEPQQPMFNFFGGMFNPQLEPRYRVVASATEAKVSGSRPGDCYHIAWCGCFLRHYFGLSDKSLNLARRWAYVGHQSSPHAGAIIVWRHHVGLLKSEPDASGRAMILSGNDGHSVRLRVRSIRGAIAFREL